MCLVLVQTENLIGRKTIGHFIDFFKLVVIGPGNTPAIGAAPQGPFLIYQQSPDTAVGRYRLKLRTGKFKNTFAVTTDEDGAVVAIDDRAAAAAIKIFGFGIGSDHL
jgi:hypothetical protein